MTTKLLFLVVFSILLGCESSLPKTEFKVEKLTLLKREKKQDFPEFELTISSTTNILEFCKKEKCSNIYLFCPLTSIDFSSDNISNEPFKINGILFNDSTTFRIGDTFYYTFEISFLNKGNHLVNEIDIKKLLEANDCIPCKMIMSFFPKKISKNYTSEKFCIPTYSITSNF